MQNPLIVQITTAESPITNPTQSTVFTYRTKNSQSKFARLPIQIAVNAFHFLSSARMLLLLLLQGRVHSTTTTTTTTKKSKKTTVNSSTKTHYGIIGPNCHPKMIYLFIVASHPMMGVTITVKVL